jgi:uridine kinase
MIDRAFVLGVSGVSGANKTILTRRLARDYPNADILRDDDFHAVTRMPSAEIREWFERGADPNEFALSELVDELARRTQIRAASSARPLLLFETPFGRLHRATGAFIDFLVWIDTPLDVALSRRLLGFVDMAQRDTTPDAKSDFLKWLRKYLANYEAVRTMYLAQREAILPTSDLVLDGSAPTEASAELVRQALSARGIEA